MSRSLPSTLIIIRYNYCTLIRYYNKRKLGEGHAGENREAAGAVFTLYFKKPTQNISTSYKKTPDNQMLPSEQRNSLKQTEQKNRQNFSFDFVPILRLTKRFSVTMTTQFHDEHVSVMDLSASRLGLQFLCVTSVF